MLTMIFLINFFLIIFFPMEALAEQINTTRAVAKTAAVNDGNKNDTRYLIKDISFRNNAPFTNCILKINNVLIDNAEVLDVVMSVYILLEYSKKNEKKKKWKKSNRKFVELL